MEEACGNSGVWPSEERMQSILSRITSYSPCLSFFHYPCLPFSPAEVPLAQPHLLCPVNPLQTLSIHLKHKKYIYFFSYALLLCFRARFSYPCLISSRRATMHGECWISIFTNPRQVIFLIWIIAMAWSWPAHLLSASLVSIDLLKAGSFHGWMRE